MMSSYSRPYTLGAVVLHWVIAILIFVLIGLGWYMVGIPKETPARAWFFNLHKSIGVTTALLIALRIAWRATHVPPALPYSVPRWQRRGAKASHFLLYACMVVMPVSGFTASNFTKFGVKFFGYQIPILGWEDKAVYKVLTATHIVTSYVLVALIAVHVAAALRHLIVRDGIFERMWPRKSEAGVLRQG